MKKIVILFALVAAVYLAAVTGDMSAKKPRQAEQASESQKHNQTRHQQNSRNSRNKLSEPTGFIKGHGYVDLGLPSGVKWATCNVGATRPEEYGDYFAWGEVLPKINYSEETSVTSFIKNYCCPVKLFEGIN